MNIDTNFYSLQFNFSEIMVFIEHENLSPCLRLHPRETANERIKPAYRGMPDQSCLMSGYGAIHISSSALEHVDLTHLCYTWAI